ncbi:MAG: biopolymer transporter ExbD [Acidobacteriota bacterium]
MEKHGKSLSEINVTPLVDVMLVLLIIFMVVAPMMHRGIDVNLPETKTAMGVDEARIVLTIDREDRIYINDRSVHIKLLKERILELLGRDSRETIFLKADRKIPYGKVLQVMDIIRETGIENISMVTNPIHEKEGRR